MQVSSLYTTMAGMQSVNERMKAVASNLANANTNGYSAVQAESETAFFSGENAPIGGAPVAVTPGPDLTQGPLQHTGDPLNVGLSGDAWLSVQTNSGTKLTRDGSMSLSNAGILVDSQGDPVLDTNGQPISLPPMSKIEIGTDGTISGVLANSTSGRATNVAQIGIVATPQGRLTQLDANLYSPDPNETLVPSTDGALHQGYLNGSNVNSTDEMMQMIDMTRSYQIQTTLLKTQSNTSAGLNTILTQE